VTNELRAYNPTWRDRVAAVLIGEGKPSRYHRNVVSSLVGSAGIGSTGFSLSDPTPAGAVFSADEMVRNARDGNYGQAALSAVGALPGSVLPAALKLAAKSNPAQRFATKLSGYSDNIPKISPQAFDADPSITIIPDGTGNYGQAAQAFAAKTEPSQRFAAKLSDYHDNIPEIPQRAFEADYPRGAVADDMGKLRYDIEGRTLIAPQIAGRRMAGGGEEALEIEGIRSIGETITGRSIEDLPERYRRQGWLGATGQQGQKPVQIYLNPDLTHRQYMEALPHEVGHAIDLAAGRIPIDGLLDELQPNYSRLYGQKTVGALITPESIGYPPEEASLEYMAEALRAYQLDPNYAKSLMPRTAARIREYVNSHPELSKIIQFNSMAAASIGGGSLLASETAEAREPGLFARTGASGIPDTAHGIAFKDVGKILEALKGRDSADGPARIAASSRNSVALDVPLAGGLDMATLKIGPVARALLLSSAERH
jgi:hypothetical protein